jgi:hypothetical protein
VIVAAQQTVPNWMKPLWVRLLLVVLPAAWAIFEALYGEQIWAVMFAIAAVWGLWTLIIKFDSESGKAGGGDRSQ